jgi:hypothetical protein
MAINVGGAQDYVPVVDAKIRRIKEVNHAMKATLVDNALYDCTYLVVYAASCIIMQSARMLPQGFYSLV